MAVNVDPGVQSILDNVQVIVASEGGSIEFVGLNNGKLTIRYNKGYNEECPECVPDHDLVRTLVQGSMGMYAPHVQELELL